jgi:O-antigen ligase
MNLLKKENLGILLLFLPISFIVGIAVTEIFLFFFIIIFFVFNKETNLFYDFKVVFLFTFSFYIALNALFQINDNLKYSSFFHFRFVIFSLSIFYISNIFQNYNKKNKILYIVLPICVLLFDSFFQLFTGNNILGFELHKNRVSSFFDDELILGSFLIRILPIIIWFIFFFKIDLKKYHYQLLIFFSLFFIVIYSSGERTSFILSLFLIFSVFILVKPLKSIFKNSFLIFLVFIIVSFFTNIGNIDLSNRIFVKTFNQITSNQLAKNEDKNSNIMTQEKFKKIKENIKLFSKDHQGHIILAIKLYKENKIFGVGPKGFRHYCRGVKYDPTVGICSTHPHNLLMQILAELGLVGFIFYLIAAIFVFKNLYKVIKNQNINENTYAFKVISLGLIINFFPFLPSGNFFNNWISIMIYYNIGIYLFSYRKLNF